MTASWPPAPLCFSFLSASRVGRRPQIESVSLIWDHSLIEEAELEGAMKAVADFPLKTAPGPFLLKQGELILELRGLLVRCAWADLSTLLDRVSSDAEQAQLEEVRNAAHELDDMRAATEAELATAMQSGRSLKTIGAKQQVLADKSYFVPVEWDHSGVETGRKRLARAVEAVVKFPKPNESARKMIDNAKLLLELRTLIGENKPVELGRALEAIEEPQQRRLDEVGMAWQEYLTYELERAVKPPTDQAALKKALARATAVGMLPMEKPMYKALAVFIDPPEFVGNLITGEVWPAPDGSLVLRVRVRGATSIHWVKNDIALKEGADGGRIKGVTTPELTITHLLGRDRGQKVWCICENKWGKIVSHKVTLRLEGDGGDRKAALSMASQPPLASGKFKLPDPDADAPESARTSHRMSFAPSLKSMASGRIPLFNRSPSGLHTESGRHDDDDDAPASGRPQLLSRGSSRLGAVISGGI